MYLYIRFIFVNISTRGDFKYSRVWHACAVTALNPNNFALPFFLLIRLFFFPFLQPSGYLLPAARTSVEMKRSIIDFSLSRIHILLRRTTFSILFDFIPPFSSWLPRVLGHFAWRRGQFGHDEANRRNFYRWVGSLRNRGWDKEVFFYCNSRIGETKIYSSG